MEYDKRHVAYRPTIGGRSIPADRLINDLGEDAIHYIGTYSEFNPIGIYNGMLVTVRKKQSVFPKKDFKLRGFILQGGLSTCGGNITCNKSISISKVDLLRICAAMDEDDTLLVSEVDNYPIGHVKDMDRVKKDIEIVTGL
jgi:hypothetical protein